jgi:DNA-directed RNA polymerase subunit H (RpoH/RPB5)
MSTFQIFQLEKNSDDIRKTVLTNLIKMLTERDFLSHDDLQKNIDNIINGITEENTFTLDILKYRGTADKKMVIRIFPQRIASISKQSVITEFLNKHKDVPKLIIVKDINMKAGQLITTNYPKTELFLESELMINLIDNILIPRYEILDRETDDFKKFCEMYNCKKRNIPKLFTTDPMARYYNLKKGDIVRVIQPSETTGYAAFYRITV